MYNIKFRIILKTYIHTQGSSCLALTLTLTLILETQARKTLTLIQKNPKKTLSGALRDGRWSFSNCN